MLPAYSVKARNSSFKTRNLILDSTEHSLRYDTIEEFNVDSKAECDQHNLAQETRTNKRQ